MINIESDQLIHDVFSETLTKLHSSTSAVTQFFTLKTGRKIEFRLIRIKPQDVASMTFVRSDTNSREQSTLTSQSLKPIIETIKYQQFLPCVGIRNGNRVEILDGSRRRAAAIYVGAPLNVMLASEALSLDEARQLARDIQTAKEHNLREIGLRIMTLKQSGLNQKQIAKQEGMSPAKVTRALQAACVASELIELFPIVSILSFSDYKFLLDVGNTLHKNGMTCMELVQNIASDVERIIIDIALTEECQKKKILKLISSNVNLMVDMSPKEKSIVTPLWSFDDKDKFARKRNLNRGFSYEFNRVPWELQVALDDAIANVLKKHFSD